MNKKILGILILIFFIVVILIFIGLNNVSNENEMKMDISPIEKENQMSVVDKEVNEAIVSEDAELNDGPMAPKFSLLELSGSEVSLDDLAGERIYIKFWASWCPICLSGLEEIDELSGEDTDFIVLTIVSPNYNGELDEVAFKEWFMTKNTMNMKVLIDTDGNIAKEYGVRGYPTSAFIGSDGVYFRQFPGHIDNEQIKNVFMEIK